MRSLLALLILALAAFAPAQGTTDADRAAQSDAIMAKIDRLDLLNQILPLVMTKQQLRDLLPSIEKARENVRVAQKEEYSVLKSLEADLNAAVKEAEEKGTVPSRELFTKVSSTMGKLYTARRLIAEGNTALVLEQFKKTANAGQIKTAVGSLNPKQFGMKAEDMTDDDKLKMYVREILLHPVAYDIMRKLSI